MEVWKGGGVGGPAQSGKEGGEGGAGQGGGVSGGVGVGKGWHWGWGRGWGKARTGERLRLGLGVDGPQPYNDPNVRIWKSQDHVKPTPHSQVNSRDVIM